MFRKSFFLLGLGTLIAGAYLYYRRQLEVLENFTYRVVGIKINSVAPLSLDISTEIVNNSEIEFTIKGYDIDVFVNNKKVAKVVNKNLDEKLSGYGSKSIINFTATLGTDDGGRVGNILSGALEVLADINIDFKGKVSVKRGIFEYSNYPVDINYKLQDFL